MTFPRQILGPVPRYTKATITNHFYNQMEYRSRVMGAGSRQEPQAISRPHPQKDLMEDPVNQQRIHLYPPVVFGVRTMEIPVYRSGTQKTQLSGKVATMDQAEEEVQHRNRYDHLVVAGSLPVGRKRLWLLLYCLKKRGCSCSSITITKWQALDEGAKW